MQSQSRLRSGFSLTELLVASGIGLTVMAAVATLFGVFSRSLSQSQSTVDLSSRMRATAWKLRQDLDGVTCPVVPWLSPDANAGYFEISEGPQRDTTLTYAANAGTSNLEADTDDVLMFTTRAPTGSFSGRYLTADRIIEAPSAEVAWFCQEAANQPVANMKVYNLHRRQLLVLGYVGLPEFSGNSIAGTVPVPAIYQTYDLSLRSEGGRLHPNTLGDLTKRENRLAHGSTFPHALTLGSGARPTWQAATFSQTDRVWEDVILTNVVSFDVRVFDPQAKAQAAGTATLYPGDPGYVAANAAGAAGAYIDLGGGQGGRLSQPPDPKSGLVAPAVPAGVATYDTWSQHYEFNGLNDDGDKKSDGTPLIDEGTNGVDDNSDGFTDNPPEYETSPPYPVPLEGVEVRIRCYDPTSKQVRQVSVRHTFRRP